MNTPNRIPDFEWAVDTFVKAYREGTLEHGSCRACAVGNLMRSKGVYGNVHWWWALDPSRGKSFYDKEKGFEQLSVLPYTHQEVDRIERAFEESDWEDAPDPQYVGLQAVFLELCNIHGLSHEHYEKAVQRLTVAA